jgi:hypothetical protein|tara:strand:+ start:3251 stop:3391 length:141 start_codon:yes stop_codon:yes gene_type:complete
MAEFMGKEYHPGEIDANHQKRQEGNAEDEDALRAEEGKTSFLCLDE